MELEKQFPECDREPECFNALYIGAGCVKVAVDGPTVVGAIMCYAPGNGHYRVIESIVVSPAHRGARIGEKLMRSAEEGVWRSIRLTVRVDNVSAKRLYARMGYVFDELAPGFYSDGADGERWVKRK
jgi:ribosomal protein S18 acetylase RimI-like enzyme